MLKTKQKRFGVVAMLVFSLIAMYGSVPSVKADSMNSAKVLLSDSDVMAVATSTVTFNLGTALIAADDYVNINFATGTLPSQVSDVQCPDGGSAALADAHNITCTGTLAANADKTITIKNYTNPSLAGDYLVTVSTHHVGGTVIETTETKVYVIDDVTVTAHVAASLTFGIASVGSTVDVNGDTTTGASTQTAIDYGTIDPGTQYVMAQQLTVSTNAADGFTVTVQQDHDMQSDGGADINAFNTAGAPWAAPTPNINDNTTFGYMGVASDDSDLASPFAAGNYKGLNGTTPLEVMSHGGPADGSTPDADLANVAYSVQISDLQEAGDYKNTLTYVCTPTF